MYGNCRNDTEMDLEMAHEQFKTCREVNNNKDAHISSMERSTGRDWISRVTMLLCCFKNGDKEER